MAICKCFGGPVALIFARVILYFVFTYMWGSTRWLDNLWLASFEPVCMWPQYI